VWEKRDVCLFLVLFAVNPFVRTKTPSEVVVSRHRTPWAYLRLCHPPPMLACPHTLVQSAIPPHRSHWFLSRASRLPLLRLMADRLFLFFLFSPSSGVLLTKHRRVAVRLRLFADSPDLRISNFPFLPLSHCCPPPLLLVTSDLLSRMLPVAEFWFPCR